MVWNLNIAFPATLGLMTEGHGLLPLCDQGLRSTLWGTAALCGAFFMSVFTVVEHHAIPWQERERLGPTPGSWSGMMGCFKTTVYSLSTELCRRPAPIQGGQPAGASVLDKLNLTSYLDISPSVLADRQGSSALRLPFPLSCGCAKTTAYIHLHSSTIGLSVILFQV